MGFFVVVVGIFIFMIRTHYSFLVVISGENCLKGDLSLFIRTFFFAPPRNGKIKFILGPIKWISIKKMFQEKAQIFNNSLSVFGSCN